MGTTSLHETVCSDPELLAREIHSDVFAGEPEIAQAIAAGFAFRERRALSDFAQAFMKVAPDLALQLVHRVKAADGALEDLLALLRGDPALADDPTSTFRRTPGGSLEVMNNGRWTHVPAAAAARLACLTASLRLYIEVENGRVAERRPAFLEAEQREQARQLAGDFPI